MIISLKKVIFPYVVNTKAIMTITATKVAVR